MAFQFCPAGMSTKAYAGLGVYVRYHKWDDKPIRVIESSTTHVLVCCPDRDLLMVTNTADHKPFYPENYDEFYSFSHFQQPADSDLNLHLAMTNATDHIGDKHSLELRRAGRNVAGTTLIADSGGFQIMRGDIEFIDPAWEIDWYNKNIDYGMVLDIPVGANKDLLKRSARVQKANTDLWLKTKADHLELINIFHGDTPELVEKFRGVVEDDRVNRVAIGGVYNLNMFRGLDKTLGAILDTDSYIHHHVLGITDNTTMFMLMYASKLGFSPLITVDSTASLQRAVHKFYHRYIGIENGINKAAFGSIGNFPTKHAMLPCNCPVCSVVKYADIFRQLSGSVIGGLIGMHNVYTLSNWSLGTSEVVEREDKKTIKELIDVQFKSKYGHEAVKQMHAALDFMDAVKEHGIEKARKKFAYYLPKQNRLFGTTSMVDARGMDEDEELQIDAETWLHRTERTIELYEKYHGLK